MGALVFCFYAICGLLSVILVIKKQRKSLQHRANLPPGSTGLPYIGETFQLYSQNPNVFFATRQNRYGDIFKTHILGYPCIMLASPEAIRFVLVSKAQLFKPTYPQSKENLIGPSALFFHQGVYHSKIKKLVQSAFSLDVIRNMLSDIEAITTSSLESWSGGHVINTFLELKKFTFNVAVLSIFGQLDVHHKDILKENYYILDKGYNSFPSNLPGTLYNKSASLLKARRRLSLIIDKIVNERKKGHAQKDLLGSLLNFKDEKGRTLTDNQIVDNVVGVLFAAQDTTASFLTWILKYMNDYSKLFEAIEVEQRAIFEANDGGKRPLTWIQIRNNMPVTNKAIMESLRMASIISFTFREAVEDVEYRGYLIPKGWKVLPLFRNIHHNPDYFTDPHIFNPFRFEGGSKPNTFLPFGNGVHACPGNEVAKVEILIFIHHLITKFRWELVEPNVGVEYSPFPVPQHGLPAKFWKQTTTTDMSSTAHF